MTKEIEKLSAWYDGEVSQDDFDEGLKNLENNPYKSKLKLCIVYWYNIYV